MHISPENIHGSEHQSQTLAPDSDKGWLPQLKVLAPLFGFFSAAFAAIAPFLYLEGRVYRDTWWGYFNLDPSMFPSSVADTTLAGGIALANVLAKVFLYFGKVFEKHWVLFITLSSALAFSMYAVIILGNKWEARRERKSLEHMKTSRSRFSRVIGFLARPLLPLLMLVSLGCLAWQSFGLIALITLYPCSILGHSDAVREATTGFKKRAVVTLKSPEGKNVSGKQMGCGPQFCAVWTDGHAVTVPLGQLTWAEAPPPRK